MLVKKAGCSFLAVSCDDARAPSVACGNVACNPGDVVIGDADGVVDIPQAEPTETLRALPGQEDIEPSIRTRIKEAVAT
jgi:regulator of RNase E activity RraA